MINNEIYWTEEYILYAEMTQKKHEEMIAKIKEEEIQKTEQVPIMEDKEEC